MDPNSAERAIKAIKRDEEFWDHVKQIGYYPHDGQKYIFKKLLGSPLRRMFLQCSRNFGKSTTLGLLGVLVAGRVPRSKVYIIAPTRTLADEIYFQSGFLDEIIPQSWRIDSRERGFNATQLRWRLKNQSYIKLDSADNEQAVRGYKPTLLLCDEFQGWKRETWQAMEPNLLAHDALCVIAGTPPDIENVYTEQANFTQARMNEGNVRYFFLKRTIYDNPRFAPEAVEEIRQAHIERGEEGVWKREYLAEFVPGGASAIFPMFCRENHVRPIGVIDAEIGRDRLKCDYYTVFDPSGSRFAVGFYAYNRATGRAYMLDGFVESDANLLSVSQIWDRVSKIEQERYPHGVEIFRLYDEQAKLFAIEMNAVGVDMIPTQKNYNQKSNNILLVRDAMVKRRFTVAEHCVDGINELMNYHRDENGKIVKKKDDLVDTTLYFFAESGYTYDLTPIRERPETERRFYRPEEELYKNKDDRKWDAPEPGLEIDNDFFDASIW